jgi:hypothetical protein
MRRTGIPGLSHGLLPEVMIRDAHGSENLTTYLLISSRNESMARLPFGLGALPDAVDWSRI